MKILLATDGSEYSEEAARFLTRFDFSEKDEIIVLHVISAIPFEDDYEGQVRHAIRRVAPKILASAKSILRPAKAAIVTVEEEGYPDTTIVTMANDAGAQLIVMGARGVKGLKKFLLGSSTRAVAISSSVPVLAIKRPPWQSSGPMKVLFAADGSEISNAAARFTASLPFPENTEVTVMHVAWSPVLDIPEKFAAEFSAGRMGKASTRSSAASEKVITEATAFLGARFAVIRAMKKTGDPSREVLKSERTLQPDMIVVGCRGLRGIRELMGSVSRRVLGHSSSSVLIGKTCAQA